MADARPKNTPELLARIEKEWQALMQVVDRLAPGQMTRPDAGGWSPKDNLAHLAAWMGYMQRAYVHQVPAAEAMGIDPAKWQQLDETGINAVLFERNRELPAEQVLQTLKTTYAEVMADLPTVPFDDLQRVVRTGSDGPVTVLDLVLGNTADHFIEHGRNIEKTL